MAATVESLRSALQRAAQERTFTNTRDVSKKKTIRSLKREIAALRRLGASWKEVADILEEDGLKASPETVRLATQQKKQIASKQAVEKTSSPRPPTVGTFGAAGREF